jgi:hypothetical protein
VFAAAAVALASTVSTSGQGQSADTSRLPALRLEPDTLAAFINDVAGQRVRLVSGVVGDVASPRVFTLRNEPGANYPHRPREVAIIVDAGSASVREGVPLVVTGIARTLLGVDRDNNPPLPSLTEGERTIVAKLPVVMASSVQTPDGVQLVRPIP